jgi:polyisoprenyl-phosphate glycosyltransferase
MDKNSLISVSAILHNAAGSIVPFLEEISAVLAASFAHYEIVLIENGSSDDTVPAIRGQMQRYQHIRLVVLSREYEQQVAWTAALESSIGDFVILMDMDSDPPRIIPDLVAKAQGGFDVVTAEARRRDHQTMLYRLLSRNFYRLSNVVTEYKVNLDSSNYVCFSRKMVNAILQVKDRVRFLKFLQTEIGYSHATIPFEPIQRGGRKGCRQLLQRFFFAVETLVSHSTKLIRLATSLALLTSIISLGYLLYALVIKIFMTDVAEGWASTSMVLALMFAVMFFILFIIGEYLALVFKETRKGPLYHVAEEFNSSSLFTSIREKNVV